MQRVSIGLTQRNRMRRATLRASRPEGSRKAGWALAPTARVAVRMAENFMMAVDVIIK